MIKFPQIRRIIRISNLSNWAIFVLTLLNFLLFYGFLSEAKIETKLKNELFIEQGIGNIYFYQYLSFKNIGTKVGRVLSIEGFIRSKDRDSYQFRRKIVARTYYYNGQIPFIEIALTKDQSFNAEFQLVKEPDRVTRDSIALIYSLGLNEYDSASKGPNYNNLLLFNVSKKLSNLIDNFNEQRVNQLQAGEYEYIVKVVTNDSNEPFYKCYSFFIYPDNITQFKEIRKDYKKYSKFVNESRRSSVNIPLTQIENKEIIESLKKEFQNIN